MKKISKNAFSIIEVLIAILIFALGISAVYMLINSSLRANNYNKNQIIAANLAREELELIKNIRDSNYKIFKIWNLKDSSIETYSNVNKFLTGHFYIIENNYDSTASFPIRVNEILDFGEGKNELDGKMNNYRLCITKDGFYTYNCSNGNKKTRFYRYIKIDNLKNREGIIKNALKITSKVIWYINGYHDISISTILTDWKRL